MSTSFATAMAAALPGTGAGAAAPTLALELAGLAVELGGRPVLHDVGLQLPLGQTLALLGPSGCGKTTLLRSIGGLVAPQRGRVLIADRDVTGLPPQARGIGMMFQSYALFPNLSVRENIAFGPLAQGWTPERARARSDELLTLVELHEHAHKHPGQLSGGQRQRVALARALAPQPALLLMDEPFSAIDESFRLPLRRAFRRLLQTLSQTCVIVTHDREEAFELADRVAVMVDGRLVRVDTPAAILQDPGSLAVARFLGAFNVFAGAPARAACTGSQTVWVAPIRSLRLARPMPVSDAADDCWCFAAQVVARHEGLQQTQLELRLEDGGLVSLIEGDSVLKPGAACRLEQPLQALVALPAA